MLRWDGHFKVSGRAEVPFQIRTSQFVQPMAVIPGLVYQVILGRDFCCQHTTILDDKEVCLSLTITK